ncbi:glutamate racemase [Phaeocystidibacter marisrubri]|uniref:Glutamate racemase n=1 Tax=Phaeocystidibacter marisrubri TaxID=1577780 RepID=A0A6L3ZDH2_9FLAO|nr:glutamate racemase [Phaeocystidibacter marisrubri]GGH71267.1 glutamate racemase [Phaeocystidibacter marisrubri]
MHHFLVQLAIRYLSQVKQPIGIFDSGVGGLTVTRAIRQLLPNEDLLYFGDTAHLPYGEKSPEAIRSYSRGIVQFLLEHKAKAIVIACNSASSVATDMLIEMVGDRIPIINVIDPIVQSIPLESKHVGIIGTRATISSGVYQEKIADQFPQKSISALATPLLVPIIEEGLEETVISENAAVHYLSLPEMKEIDTLIPGCTHYPLLTKLFSQILGEDVAILNTPQIVALNTQQRLGDLNLLEKGTKPGIAKFYVSDYTPTFERIAKHFFGADISLSELDIWK